MRRLLSIILAFACFAVLQPTVQAAAKAGKANRASKERLVLMPLRVPDEDKSLAGSMETALVEGLQQKYEVFSGEQVSQKAKAIFLKESKNTTKKECDETRCMQDIAEAFQAELIATANVTKRPDGYFLSLSVQNIFDNKVVYSKSMPCKNCDAYDVVEKLKELSGTSVQAKPLATNDEPVVAINTNNPESELWVEVQKGNSIDDYTAYLKQYPKGKYSVLAQSRLNQFKNEAAAEAARQEKGDWDTASSTGSEESYEAYLSQYPKGKYVVLALSRLKKVKEDADTEADWWAKAQKGNTISHYQAYLVSYPKGKYITLANAGIKKIVDVKEVELPQITKVTTTLAPLSAVAETVPGYASTNTIRQIMMDPLKIMESVNIGNCTACHAIPSRPDIAAGDIGPPFIGMRERFPDIATLRAAINDQRALRPQTVMPPFGRNKILMPEQIEAVVQHIYQY